MVYRKVQKHCWYSAFSACKIQKIEFLGTFKVLLLVFFIQARGSPHVRTYLFKLKTLLKVLPDEYYLL
jgi:hypothetical protein